MSYMQLSSFVIFNPGPYVLHKQSWQSLHLRTCDHVMALRYSLHLLFKVSSSDWHTCTKSAELLCSRAKESPVQIVSFFDEAFTTVTDVAARVYCTQPASPTVWTSSHYHVYCVRFVIDSKTMRLAVATWSDLVCRTTQEPANCDSFVNTLIQYTR